MRKGSRAALTKDQILPMQRRIARDLSLQNHLALVAMRTGRGTPDAIGALSRTLYVTYYMARDTASDVDLSALLIAEEALEACIEDGERNGVWHIEGPALPAVEYVLCRFDEVLARVPSYRYTNAVARVSQFLQTASQSPLPGSRVKPV